MKLYCSPFSPYARKVMILIRLKGLDVEEVGVTPDLKNGYTKGVNPVGKIPALVRSGHPVMVDSPVICQYLDSLKDSLLPASGEARWNQLRLHAMGDAIADATYSYRFETVRDKSLHWDDYIERHENGLRSVIAALESEADQLGASWEFGNLAIICGLDYMGWRAGHIDWRSFAPKLAAWHAGFESAPFWRETYAYDDA